MTTALEKLRELEKLASDGWVIEKHHERFDITNGVYSHEYGKRRFYAENMDEADARLICAARNLLPAFLEFLSYAKNKAADDRGHGYGDGLFENEIEKLEQAIEKELGGE